MNENIVDINGILDRIIKETGIDQKELSVLLGYNEAYLSQARQKGTKKLYKALENYEREFRKSKNLNPVKQPTLSVVKESDEELKTKIIVLQDQNIKNLEYIKSLEQQIRTQGSIYKDIEDTKKALERELGVIKEQIKNFEERAMSNFVEYQEDATGRMAMLHAIQRNLNEHRKIREKASLEDLQNFCRIVLAEETKKLLNQAKDNS